MTNLTFVTSIVSSLAIPATVVTALILFRKPLTDLIGRVSTYEGLGQKLQFGQKLAGAEQSVNEAVTQAGAELSGDHGESRGSKDADTKNLEELGLAKLAATNPSFVIIKAWEELSGSLDRLVRIVMSGTYERRTPIYWLPTLVADGVVNESFSNAVRELFDLRNQIAHGKNDPTPGEAIAYAKSARQLSSFAAYNVGRQEAIHTKPPG
jgi:hypothetical protein